MARRRRDRFSAWKSRRRRRYNRRLKTGRQRSAELGQCQARTTDFGNSVVMALVAIFGQATTGEIVRQRVYERRLRGDENRHYKDKQTPVTKKGRHGRS